MPRFRTLDDLDVAGKRVLVRADLNVPVKDGKVTDATRIERLAPTIAAIIERGGKPIVMSHFGRPKGPDPSQSLRPLVEPLSRAIGGRTVHFAPDCVGPEAERVVAALQPGEIALLENLRFHPGEEKNDPDFARQLAALGDVYVDDAFSAAHRAHASIEALAHLLPAAAGKNMQAELEALGAALENPHAAGHRAGRRRQGLDQARPAAIHHRQGRPAGDRRRDGEHLSVMRRAGRSGARCASRTSPTRRARSWQQAKERGCEIILPEDAVTAEKLEPGVVTRTVGINAVPATAMILDIGPQSVARDRRRRSKPRRRWCGTARSAPSRRRPSTAARSRSRKRSPS